MLFFCSWLIWNVSNFPTFILRSYTHFQPNHRASVFPKVFQCFSTERVWKSPHLRSAFICERKDGWLLIVSAYTEHILLSLSPHLHFSLFWFQFTFSPSALLFLFIRIGKIDYGVINQKWSGVDEQCCGSLRKPPCPLFPLGRPYSITLPYVLTPSFHFSVCFFSQIIFLKINNSKIMNKWWPTMILTRDVSHSLPFWAHAQSTTSCPDSNILPEM